MCGIAGIYAYHYAADPVDRDELGRIRDRMASRGPDGAGDWYSADGRVGLGHQRLAIIDLSPGGAQPMASSDGRQWISFNGEIYNYRELRAQLEAEGARFATQSDTEVLLELYRRRGTGMFSALRGMYAFILWDADRAALLLARDPYGIKPLYYADDGWTVRAASQVKALLAGGRVDGAIEPAGITGFYLWGHVPEPFTLHRAIRQVPAGHYLWVDGLGAGTPEAHASIAAVLADASAQRNPPADAVREALLESVRFHLVADVPVAIFLSAGIDSGTLLALASECGYRDLRTVTLAFDEFSGTAQDEAPMAASVAARYGSRHTTRRVSFDEFRGDLPRIFDAMDQPTIDGINSWFVAKAAAELGIKVALSGLGGDELFGGYASFREIPRWVRRMAVPSRIPGLGVLADLLLQSFGSRASPKLRGIVRHGGSYAGAYLLKRGLFLPSELKAHLPAELWRPGLARLRQAGLANAALRPDPGRPQARIAALESQLYMRNQLLRDTDWASMAHSVEVRVPMVDYALLRRLAGYVRAGALSKAQLADAARPPLPGALLQRPKTGFTTPVDRWLQRMVEPRDSGGAPWARHWASYVLRRWERAA